MACHAWGSALEQRMHISMHHISLMAGELEARCFPPKQPLSVPKPCQSLSDNNDMYAYRLNIGVSHMSTHRKLATYT